VHSRLRAYAERDGRGYPDWAIRYVPVVRRLRRSLEAAHVVEIGARGTAFSEFTKTPVIVVDPDRGRLRRSRERQDIIPIAADLEALPFADDTVDVCVCMDSFEHLDREGRRRGATEIVRVLAPQGHAAVSFPSGHRSFQAEERVRTAYRRATGGTLPWLEEHAARGLPSPIQEYARFLELAGSTHRVSRRGNGALWVWEGLCKVLLCGWGGRFNVLLRACVRLLTPVLARIHFGYCYRTLIWLEPGRRSKAS